MKWIAVWGPLVAFLLAVAYLVMTGQHNAVYDANGNRIHIDKSILMKM